VHRYIHNAHAEANRRIQTSSTQTHPLRIRDLNDEINKLIREKGHWERRIVELGGPDYSKSAPKVADSKGREVAEMTGDWKQGGNLQADGCLMWACVAWFFSPFS